MGDIFVKWSALLPPLLGTLYRRLQRTLASVPLFIESRRLKIAESPELDYKPVVRALAEFLWITWRNCQHVGYWNHNRDSYFRLNLDLRNGRRAQDYVLMSEFNPRMRQLNNRTYNAWELFNNKWATSVLFEKLGVRASRLYGHVTRENDGLYLFRDGKLERLDQHLAQHDVRLICKPLSYIGGKGIFMIESSRGTIRIDGAPASFADIENRAEDFCMLEEYVQQHEALAAFNPSSVNTLRLITVRSPQGGVDYAGGILRMGRAGSLVDNGGAGGLFVLVDENGICGAVAKPLKGGYRSFTKHPDTNVRFEGAVVPFFHEARALIEHAHRVLGPVHSLGWDVAITEDGPVIIEVNANWHTTMPQIVGWPGRAIFERYFAPSAGRSISHNVDAAQPAGSKMSMGEPSANRARIEDERPSALAATRPSKDRGDQ